ncbi:MAG: arylesterase [Rhodocyclales bacterium]|nr:arylesterase [Rhodocyclales bacterium]
MSILPPFFHPKGGQSFTALLFLALALLATALPASAATILVFGDSLSAGYGLPPKSGWPHLLQRQLDALEPGAHRVIDASASGETTAGGVSRLPRLLERHRPDVVVLALGANDGLRGLPPQAMQANLERMILMAKQTGCEVVLVGMRLPPNLGPEYTAEFEAVYPRLAARYPVHFVPFLLEAIALDPDAFQEDGLHPVQEAVPKLLETVWPAIAAALQEVQKKHGTASRR